MGGAPGLRPIGAAKGDLHSRQLWIDQDRLLFVRMLQPNGADSAKTDDVHFDNYKLEPHGWMSETVIETTDGKLTLKEVYANVRINAASTRRCSCRRHKARRIATSMRVARFALILLPALRRLAHSRAVRATTLSAGFHSLRSRSPRG